MNKMWKRVCAGVSAAIMSITIIGAMPFVSDVSATNDIFESLLAESIGTEHLSQRVIVPRIDFDDYSTLVIPVKGGSTADSADLTGWSQEQPMFTIQNDVRNSNNVYVAGNIHVNIEKKDISGEDRYFNQNINYYSENGVAKTSDNVALNYYANKNNKLNYIALAEGEKLVYNISVHSGRYVHLYNRTNGDSDTAGILNALFTVKDGKLIIYDGKTKSDQAANATPLGTVTLPADQWVDINLVYTAGDGKDNSGTADTVDVYMNDAQEPSFSGTLAVDYLDSSSSRLTFHGKSVFDNFSVIKYEKAVESIDNDSVFGINHQPNDFTYFHSERVMLNNGEYEFARLSATADNRYYIEPSDKKNQYKGDKLIMTRESGAASTDSYVALKVPTYEVVTDYIPINRAYKYFHIEGLFHITSTDLGGDLVRLCYETTNGATRSVSAVSYGGGKLTVGDAEKTISVKDGSNNDKWYYLKIIVNIEDGSYDAVLDGELLCQNKAIEGIEKLVEVQTYLNQGTGDLQIREMEVTGLSKEPRLTENSGVYDFDITHTSQFIDDNLTKSYLSDKVVFHGDGDMTYNKGTKTEYEDGAFVIDDEARELFVPLAILNSTLGTGVGYSGTWSGVVTEAEPKFRDDVVLAPVKQIAKALGYKAEYYKYGKMVIVAPSDAELPISNDLDAQHWFDEQYYSKGWCVHPQTVLSDVQEIANFVFYDRPLADELEISYNEFISNAEANNKDTHPRLVLTPDKVAEIKHKIAEDTRTVDDQGNAITSSSKAAYRWVYKDAIAKIESNARDVINKNYLVKYEFNADDEYRTLSAAGHLGNNMIKLGLAYHLTENEELKRDCAELAVRNMKKVATFPDFNYGHVIDAGVWLYGCAIGFDWFYDEFTEQEREEIAEGILEIGLRPMNRTFYAMLPSALSRRNSTIKGNMGNANHYVKWKSNFIPYTQHGLVMASLVFADYDKDVCFDTIEKCVRNWEYSNLGLYPAGGWLEGKSYLNVVHTNTAVAFSSLLNVMGDEYNILEATGFEESLDALIQMTSSQGTFGYADDSEYHGGMVATPGSLCFYADYYDRDELHKVRQYRYREGDKGAWNWLDTVFHKHFDKSVSTLRSEGFSTFENIHYTEGTEIVTIHEPTSTRNGNFFAIAGGPTRHYHFHNDGGDFNLCMGGRWTQELGTGNYNIGTNYTKYAGRAEGHNTLVIKPDDDPATEDTVTSGGGGYTWTAQREDSFAAVMDYSETQKGAYTTLDMTELYEHTGAQRVHRGMWIDNNYDTATIRDEIVFPEDEEFDGWWFMHTRADGEFVDDNTIILRMMSNYGFEEYLKNKGNLTSTDRDGDGDVDKDDQKIYWDLYASKLYVQIEVDGADEYEVRMMPAEPLPSSPIVENDPTANDGVNKVAIYYKGSGEIDITVRATTSSNEYNNVAVNTMAISEWSDWESRYAKLTETEDTYEYTYSIPAEYNENYTLYVAEYSSSNGRLLKMSPTSATYNEETRAYDCAFVPQYKSTSSRIYTIYLWDKTNFVPITQAVNIRSTDMAVIVKK